MHLKNTIKPQHNNHKKINTNQNHQKQMLKNKNYVKKINLLRKLITKCYYKNLLKLFEKSEIH